MPADAKDIALRDGGLAWGATNSGKSYRNARHFVRRCAKYPGKHLLIGANMKLLETEIIPLIRSLCRTYKVPCSKFRGGLGQMQIGKSLVIVMAIKNKGDEDRCRSLHNIDSIMFEEITNIPEIGADMATSRQGYVVDNKLGPVWASCNPSHPTNWVKKRLDAGKWIHDEMFLVKDNPSLTPEQVEEFESRYTGIFRKRMIEALWAAPEGLIYPNWTDAGTEIAEELKGTPCWIGADYGFSSVTAAVYVQRKDQKFYMTREYYHDAHSTGEHRNSVEGAKYIIKKAPGPIMTAYVDPTSKDLIDALSNQGVSVEPACNKSDGYNIFDGALQRGYIQICKDLVPCFVDEVYSLIYNKTGSGPDPNCIDHATDSGKYLSYGISDLFQTNYSYTRYG